MKLIEFKKEKKKIQREKKKIIKNLKNINDEKAERKKEDLNIQDFQRSIERLCFGLVFGISFSFLCCLKFQIVILI